jgi:hypothetical protein
MTDALLSFLRPASTGAAAWETYARENEIEPGYHYGAQDMQAAFEAGRRAGLNQRIY